MKHPCSDGVVGCDIGTQTIAYTSDHDVGLENLAERGQSIRHTERQQRLVLRAMDRSRRATNPGNYNPDGTIRKGKKIWIKSNRYRKLQKRHQELCRIAAENRKFAIHGIPGSELHNRENRKGHLTVCPSEYRINCILRIRTVRHFAGQLWPSGCMSVSAAPEQMCLPKSMGNYTMYAGTRIPSAEPHRLACGFGQSWRG